MRRKCMWRCASAAALSAPVLLVLALLAPANASEKQCYVYDAHGRLVKVVRAGPDGDCATTSDNVTTDYAYDDADNRTDKDVTGVPP